MSNFKNSKVAKATSVFVSVMTGITMLGGVAVVPAAAATIDELQAQINALLAQLNTLKGTTSTTSSGVSYTFTKDLRQGSTGVDVLNLQKVLNSNSATQVASVGAGSPGNETSTFGPATKAAVIKFQNLYASEVLSPVGLTKGTGYVGAASRAKLNMLAVGGTTSSTSGSTTTTTTTTSVGSGLTVSNTTQPANSLAPQSAARLPFTKFTVTASNDGDVTVNGFVVERGALAADAAFSEVVLLDEQGNQVGIAKTLNSDHRTTVGDTIVIKKGETRTFTLGGNMASDNSTRAGQVATLSLVGVNSTATVSGSLPITGAAHTINATLSIGSVTMQRGTIDPGSNQTKEVGSTDYTFSSVKVTAGSAEKIYLRSIRWNQSGSSSGSDVSASTYVDGKAYPLVASADGKYFTSNFDDNGGKGILIDKGFSKEVSIKGEVKGGSNRTIAFDVAKRRDINLVGELYGYGITPPQTNSCGASTGTACFTSGEDPWYDGAIVTVSNGTMTVSSSNAVPAQNVAVNLNSQPLGAITVDVKGEAISVARMAFNVTLGSEGASVDIDDITNITLVDETGSVVAGPVDGSASDSSDTSGSGDGSFTFTDTVTFPIGMKTYKLYGKYSTDFTSGITIAASTTPSNDWSTVRGQSTGNTITASPSSAITTQTMTVRAGSLSISVSSSPTARTVVAGARSFEFARYIFDGTASGEDVRITTLPLEYNVAAGSANDLTNCRLFDFSAGTQLTSGSNIVNPTAAASGTTFTFDGTGLSVAKGVSKTVSLKCDVSSSATGRYYWGLDSGQQTSYTGVSGLTSGQTISETLNDGIGQAMTGSTGGSYTVARDTAAAYDFRAVRSGTNVKLAALKFTAGSAEDVTIKQLALEMGNTASSAPQDLVGQKVTLWKGGVQVGEAQFGLGSNGDYATSTLTTPFVVKANETEVVEVRGDFIAQDANTNPTSTAGNGGYGAFMAINYDGGNNGLNGNYGTGIDSGSTISGGTTSDVSTNGVRAYRNVPTVTVTSNGGSLTAGADLYKFTVSNPDASRDIIVKKFTFSVATTGGAVTGFTLYGDGVAMNSSATDAPNGLLEIYASGSSSSTAAAIVPAGSSKTYVLRAATAVDTASVSETIALALTADAGQVTGLSGLMGQLRTVDAGTDNDIIWSPFSTTSPESSLASESNLDWTNGYGLPGFPATGQDFAVQVWTRAN